MLAKTFDLEEEKRDMWVCGFSNGDMCLDSIYAKLVNNMEFKNIVIEKNNITIADDFFKISLIEDLDGIELLKKYHTENNVYGKEYIFVLLTKVPISFSLAEDLLKAVSKKIPGKLKMDDYKTILPYGKKIENKNIGDQRKHYCEKRKKMVYTNPTIVTEIKPVIINKHTKFSLYLIDDYFLNPEFYTEYKKIIS